MGTEIDGFQSSGILHEIKICINLVISKTQRLPPYFNISLLTLKERNVDGQNAIAPNFTRNFIRTPRNLEQTLSVTSH